MTPSTARAEQAGVGLAVPRPPSGRHAARKAFCGNLDTPGTALDNLAEIDYSRSPTSVDQARIESWLRAADLTGKVLLHVGVGNSSLARGLADRLERVDGVTVHPQREGPRRRAGGPELPGAAAEQARPRPV